MSKKIKILLALIAIFICVPFAFAEDDGMVRVKLTRLGTPQTLVFTSDCDYYINNSLSSKIPAGSTITITCAGSNMTIKTPRMEKEFGSSFTINRKTGGKTGVKFSSPTMANTFTGDFLFKAASGKITTIMTTYVEDYLAGVVAYEMSNSYPLPALKSQAIAARNYVLRAKAGRSKNEYDVVDNANDQVYKGYNPSYTKVLNAISSTAGKVLYYENALAACYYGGSNGGQTEASKNPWGGKGLAYSIVKDDPYDLESGATHRDITFSKDQTGVVMNKDLRACLIDGIKPSLEKYSASTKDTDITINKIISIVPQNPKYPAPSILYKELLFTIEVTSIDKDGKSITGNASCAVPTYDNFEKWFELSINSSSNETIMVTEDEETITVTFRRWGHGIGMSQRGAKVMADNYGFKYEDILAFYYPGTTLTQLTLTDTTGVLLGGGSDWDTPIAKAKIVANKAGGTVTVRKGPSAASEAITKLKDGTSVDVYNTSGIWAGIRSGAYQGYVKAKFLKKEAGSPTPTPTLTPTPTPEPTPTPAPTKEVYMRVKLSGKNAKLNMRAKPSTSSKVVAKLKNNKLVKLISKSGKWARISLANGKKGYVYKKYLKKTDYAGSAAALESINEGLALILSDCNVYAMPDNESGVLCELYTGTEVSISNLGDDWVFVSVDDFEGYIEINNLLFE